MRKKISVCLASYNGEKYIKEQLESILPQLDEKDEVIISDDRSSDDTVDTIRSLEDSRIKIIYNQNEKGYSKNFENAINSATGDIIFLCDQDDVWMPNKVQIMLMALQNADLAISDAMITNENLTSTLGSHFTQYKTKRGFINNLLKTRYIGACMAFRKTMLSKVLPFPKNQKLCAHDYWIANIGELYYKTQLVDTPLIKYRRHGSNASNGGETSKNSLSHKLKVRFYTFAKLISRISK